MLVGFLTILCGVVAGAAVIRFSLKKSTKPWRKNAGVRIGVAITLTVLLSPLYIEYADGADGYAVKLDKQGRVAGQSSFGVICWNHCSSGARHLWFEAKIPLVKKNEQQKEYIVYLLLVEIADLNKFFETKGNASSTEEENIRRMREETTRWLSAFNQSHQRDLTRVNQSFDPHQRDMLQRWLLAYMNDPRRLPSVGIEMVELGVFYFVNDDR